MIDLDAIRGPTAYSLEWFDSWVLRHQVSNPRLLSEDTLRRMAEDAAADQSRAFESLRRYTELIGTLDVAEGLGVFRLARLQRDRGPAILRLRCQGRHAEADALMRVAPGSG